MRTRMTGVGNTMRSASRVVRSGIGLGLLALPLLAGAPVAANAATAPPASGSEQAATDQRINALQTALGITAAQMPEWTVFSQAMRDNAAATDALFRDRAANAATMNAVDNMRSYAAVARAYADDTQKLSDAFAALYGTLSDAQKHTADTLFRAQAQKQAEQQAGAKTK